MVSPNDQAGRLVAFRAAATHACTAAVAVLGFAGSLWGQQATITTPLHTNSSSFFEQMGTQWGVNGPGFTFSFGGGGMARPGFGNPDPSAGIRSGWNWQSGPWSGYFNFLAAQGNSTSTVSQSPSITLPNGGTGYFSDTSQSPFVIGFMPVVGSASYLPYPSYGYPLAPPAGFGFPYSGAGPVYPQQGNHRVQAMLRANAARDAGAEVDLPPAAPMPEDAPVAAVPAEPEGIAAAAADRVSTAALPAPSVAEARRMHEQEQAAVNREAMQLFERGVTAEQSGKTGVARVYYRMAAQRSDGDLRAKIEARLASLTP